MRRILIFGLFAATFGLVVGESRAEEWYDRPSTNLTIVMDTARYVYDGSVIIGDDTVRCDLEIMARWPLVASGPSQQIVDSLNNFLSKFANDHFELAPGSDLQERVLAEFDTILNDRWPAESLWGGAHWHLDVVFLECRILSLRVIRNVCVSCNGHPYHEYYYHFRLPDLTEIVAESLFFAGSVSYLDSIGALAFRRDQHIPDDTTFRQAGYDLDENPLGKYAFPKFALCRNFQITDSGIVYVYNAYTIASGAMGMSYAYLSWEQLKPVIRPDGPLGWVLKEN